MYPPCDPNADATNLRMAMKGAGTDERLLINIICNRGRDQLQQIAAVFQAKFGRHLRSEIKSETSGNFRKILVKRFDPPIITKSKALHEAMKGAGTNEGRLIDCLAFTPNCELMAVKAIYKQRSGRDLVSRIASETSGHLKQAFVDLCDGNRDESPMINPAQIQGDARSLFKAGEGKIGTDEKVFIKILCNHAPWYNMALNTAYGQTYKHDLRKAIDKEFSFYLKSLLLALCQLPFEYWADRLYSAMKGAGTDDKTVVYVFSYLERSELHYVAGLIKQRHGKDLIAVLRGDLSGHYLHACLALLGVAF